MRFKPNCFLQTSLCISCHTPATFRSLIEPALPGSIVKSMARLRLVWRTPLVYSSASLRAHRSVPHCPSTFANIHFWRMRYHGEDQEHASQRRDCGQVRPLGLCMKVAQATSGMRFRERRGMSEGEKAGVEPDVKTMSSRFRKLEPSMSARLEHVPDYPQAKNSETMRFTRTYLLDFVACTQLLFHAKDLPYPPRPIFIIHPPCQSPQSCENLVHTKVTLRGPDR